MEYDAFEKGRATMAWAHEEVAAYRERKAKPPEPEMLYPDRGSILPDEHIVMVGKQRPSTRTLMRRLGIR